MDKALFINFPKCFLMTFSYSLTLRTFMKCWLVGLLSSNVTTTNHHWGCTSIYRPLYYPFSSLILVIKLARKLPVLRPLISNWNEIAKIIWGSLRVHADTGFVFRVISRVWGLCAILQNNDTLVLLYLNEQFRT